MVYECYGGIATGLLIAIGIMLISAIFYGLHKLTVDYESLKEEIEKELKNIKRKEK